MPGTAPDLTSPPVTGAPAQVSSKVATPIDPPEGAAKALASRRESVTAPTRPANLSSSSSPSSSTDKLATTAQTDAKKLKQFVEDGRHFSLVRNFRLADLVTLGNGFCGAMSLFSSARYLLTSDPKYLWQALWLPLGGFIFDALDGKVARWRNESSMLGQELDSLADSISFGVAPAMCAFCIGLRSQADTIVLTAFVCAGIARLARFNATVALIPKDKAGKSKYFEGLPIPSSLILVGVMAGCLRRGLIEAPGGRGQGLPYGLIRPLFDKTGIELHYASLVFVAWAAMMVSKTLRIPKL
ncbi:CDP-diacylglycerol-serine O-phosphatidyltransferase [Microbotryomycetes sp. JL221]|nr:CDP-diacylglycerol-serine O-phosphatidyltransferase [Microbotryomycetes sp. JL221]